ncbi:hypothetical protein [Lysinibacillus sp. 54212]|uniref:hypothetical protein n=1 Tax=Lysinibacillus sp. 54212 TaxID=3119829 RepID=UPI002FC79629
MVSVLHDKAKMQQNRQALTHYLLSLKIQSVADWYPILEEIISRNMKLDENVI